jgi:hypothetical protein
MRRGRVKTKRPNISKKMRSDRATDKPDKTPTGTGSA